jgi:hypothetical protein
MHSNWPTYLQLYYHKGEVHGGCEILLEMKENGELKSFLEWYGMCQKLSMNYYQQVVWKSLGCYNVFVTSVIWFMVQCYANKKCPCKLGIGQCLASWLAKDEKLGLELELRDICKLTIDSGTYTTKTLIPLWWNLDGSRTCCAGLSCRCMVYSIGFALTLLEPWELGCLHCIESLIYPLKAKNFTLD